MVRKRVRWKAHQGKIAPERLVFIDETWVKANMAPLRGWGPKGQRLKAAAPFGHWKTMTVIAALRHDRIDAPWVIDGPINGELFRLYIEQVLAPTPEPGDVVALDNLGSHKGEAARAAVRARGTDLIPPPPYSPDLNPIEQVFAKLKHLMQGAQPRTVEDTRRKAGQPLDLFSLDECTNQIINAGSGSVEWSPALARACVAYHDFD
ncbi:COG3335 Transposase and inactivated derivatives [Caulobacteraceae bacterium]